MRVKHKPVTVYAFLSISEVLEPVDGCEIYTQDGGSRYLLNVPNYMPDYTASYNKGQ
jgi:hypothetical protein